MEAVEDGTYETASAQAKVGARNQKLGAGCRQFDFYCDDRHRIRWSVDFNSGLLRQPDRIEHLVVVFASDSGC